MSYSRVKRTLDQKAERYLRRHLKRVAHYRIFPEMQNGNTLDKVELIYEDRTEKNPTFGFGCRFSNGAVNIYEVRVYGGGRSFKMWEA